MVDSTTEARVRKMIASRLRIDEDRITPEASFERLGADSLHVVEVIMDCEDVFGIEIGDEEGDAAWHGTFGALCDIVDGKLAEKIDA